MVVLAEDFGRLVNGCMAAMGIRRVIYDRTAGRGGAQSLGEISKPTWDVFHLWIRHFEY
jgi:hypothetical protein